LPFPPGAVKNTIAIACGASAGFGFGHNTTALLITRGLVEMTKLTLAKGAKASTATGLAGVGDLLLTCTSIQSRNFTVGTRIAKGETLAQISLGGSVAEGVLSSRSIHDLASQLGVEM
jgi:glycerol-3-phosphate dehydrogenase (NAD(P)+)